MIRSRQKKPGSSLLLVLLMISGISVVVFASQRLGLVQFSQSNREEDNIYAYYAAKAGIEDGLARYRFNRDTEIGTAGDITAPERQVIYGKSFYYGLNNALFADSENFEANTNQSISNVDGLNFDSSQQFYKLEMRFSIDSLTYNTELPSEVESDMKDLKKDNSVTLTGFNTDPTQPEAYLAYNIGVDKTQCDNLDQGKTFVQMEQLRQDNNQVVAQRRVLLTPQQTIKNSTTDGGNWSLRPPGITVPTAVRLRAYGCDIKFGLALSKSLLGNGGVEDRGGFIDSLTTLITSTGHYGNAKVTLVAEVDRTSNTLIGVYDYNLYSGGDIAPAGGVGAD